MSILGIGLLASTASAQSASFPPEPAPAPTPTPAPAPTPPNAPAPAPAAQPPAAAPTPAPAVVAPAPAPAPASAPAPAPPPQQQPYAADPNAQPGYGSSYGEPPPPPAPPPESDSSIPPFSVRIDPFNWLLIGRLGLEIEVGVTKWMTIETVPIFVLNDTPPLMNYGSYDVHLFQHSGGLGPLAGASLGVNFWLGGKAFKGYALQASVTNYSMEYEAKDDNDVQVDSVSHVERQFRVMFGSVSRWGAFTIGGGIGLGYDLNGETRCYPRNASDRSEAQVGGDCGQIQLATSDPVNLGPIAVVTSFTYPWDILARFSLGVTID